MISNYKITLQAVYSETVSTPKEVTLPPNFSLYWHQAETLKALRDPNIDVIFNYAMTGEGKSLAVYLETMQTDFLAIGLYPTNELARDQQNQIQKYIELFQPKYEPRVVRLSGQELEIYAENEGLKKAAAIESRAFNSEILLTNPDILHYLHRGAYIIKSNSHKKFQGDNPDKLWGRIDKNFDLFIFDEFHVFSAPQVAGVINILLLIKNTNRRKKFVFLSATPNAGLIERLEKANFRCRQINPLSENKYLFPENKEEVQKLESQNFRQVSREISLNFISLEANSKASEIWLKKNIELVRKHFQNNPGTKGAILLNSIAAVKRLTVFYQEILAKNGLTVGENTGLSGRETKEKSLAADLVIGTSTIDVGVDFNINFLLFESADSGNFIQRLGRLGRHDGYEKEGDFIRFNNFTAYALIPNFLVERLFEVESPPLASGGVYNRPFFHEMIRENYRKINNFDGYYRKWGAVQSVKICWDLGKLERQYFGSQKEFKNACKLVFQTSLGKVAGNIKDWQKEWQELSGNKTGNPIVEDACSFRGVSSLECGIYDLTESNNLDRFKTYELPGILSNLEIESMTKKDFLQLLDETVEKTGEAIAKGRLKYCLAFMKLRSYREERLDWKFTYRGSLESIVSGGKVQVLQGVEVWQPENNWIGEINKRLRQRGLVCYVLEHPVEEVRRRLQLPMHFQIYGISDSGSIHDKSPPYSIAFGQSALLVDTLGYRMGSKGGEIWVV
ncbi:MAG: type I-D CRISPR-associated helicase Cas3' [Okeania sp. SIO3C4]|nr:type I-D CRISPR-associated helicase Cas3' [Okeania sp. SIO3C4]